MLLVLLLILILLCAGGGWGYYGGNNRLGHGGMGLAGIVLIALVIYLLMTTNIGPR